MQETMNLIGGPLDGQSVPFPGIDKMGIFYEIPNPDREIWGDCEFLAYGYEWNEDRVFRAVYPNG